MRLLEFTIKYGDEASCKALFKEYRERQGLTCRKCGGNDHSWLPTVDRWQCRQCQSQIGLRSGTLLEASKLPYHYWIYAIYLMTSTKKGISALEMQRQLGHKRYEPIWAMMHKIRAAMGKRDSRYQMEGLVELDDGFVKSNRDKPSDHEQGNKQGRGTQDHTPILMMAKAAPGKEKGKKPTAFRYIRMAVMADQKGKTVQDEAGKVLTGQATVISDNFRSFSRLKEIVKEHAPMNVPANEASTMLPWVHTMISNLKRNLLGINHSVKEGYLQNYLNEFCYKTNRRYFGAKLFDRLMIASVEDTWYPKAAYANG